MLRLVIGAIVVVFSWIVVLLLPLPQLLGIVVTVVVIATLVGLNIARRVRARRSARALEKAISIQGDAHAARVRPELEADIRTLQREFQRAVAALKASRLGKGGTHALYALPWYVIVGPPGAGKSTALRNSGLQFPYLSKAGGAVRGIGGTRNCDWWLTNEAIVLDTAGRFTTDNEDREEWLAFLDLLKHNRPQKPIDGILVAIGVTDVADLSEEGVTTHAQRIRERIDELTERLQMVVPVYLLFTKCDLVEGFVETFQDLKKQERGQIWGFTLPLGNRDAAPGSVFSTHFEELYEGLKTRALRRLAEERALEARERIFAFPEQFLLLHDRLNEFVGTMFEENIYKEPPVLRGVYFTSGTQEGSPIDRVMAKMMQAFGATARSSPSAVVEQKSYFLRDAFAEVIFRDRHLAVRARDEIVRQTKRAYAIGGAVVASSLLTLLLPAYAFVQNRELIASTDAIVAKVAARRAAPRGGPAISLRELEALSRRVDELYGYEVKRPPAGLRFGMYTGRPLYQKLKDLYAEVLRTEVLGPLVERDRDAMQDFVTRANGGQATNTEFGRFYDVLKMYLCVTGPRDATEPSLGPVLQSWLVDHIVAAWVQDLGVVQTDDTLQQMTQHIQLFVELLASDPSLALRRDAKRVSELRVALGSRSPADLLLEPLITDMADKGYDISLSTILGTVSGPIQSHAAVRGAFTRRGWEERIRPALAQVGFGEPWVLGREGARTSDESDLLRLVRERYFSRYVDEWKEFLRSLRIRQTSSSVDVIGVLQEMTRGVPPPIGRILREVAYNSDLDDERPLSGKTDKLTGRVLDPIRRQFGGSVKPSSNLKPAQERGAADVAAAFSDLVRFGVPPTPTEDGSPSAQKPQPVELDLYQEQLESLRDALTSSIESPGSTQQLEGKVQAVRTRVGALIDAQPVWWRTLLWTPIENATRSIRNTVITDKEIQWCNDVVVPFSRSLQSKYPFQPNGADAPLADLADFYRPDGGVLWKFYQSSLAVDIPEVGDRRFEPATRLGQRSNFSAPLPTFLSRSREITDVLFPPGAKDPLVEFEVRIDPTPGVASILFVVDGQRVSMQNEPDRWQPLRWPAEGKSHGAALQVRGAQNLSETIRRDGEWGLFRLLEAGRVSANLTTRDFSVTWPLSSRNVQVTLHVRPHRAESPFFGLSRRNGLRLYQSFRGSDVLPPHAIAPGGGCKVQGPG